MSYTEPPIADCVIHTKRLLNSNTRTERDSVANTGSGGTPSDALTTSSTSLKLTHKTDGIRAGSYISVGDGTNPAETMYVHSRNGEFCTVARGVDGSAGYAWSQGTVIEVEPRFTEFQILEAVRDAIRALPNNLYAVSNTSVEFAKTDTQAVTSSDIQTTGFYHLISATRTARNAEDRLLNFNVSVQRHTDGTFKIVRQEGIEKAVTAYIRYAHPFVTTTLNMSTRLDDDIKMEDSMRDIPALGAASALVLSEESLRLDLHSQGDSRSEGAVAAGDRTRYSLMLQAQYDRRISEEARRLMSLYGIRDRAGVSSIHPTTLL